MQTSDPSDTCPKCIHLRAQIQCDDCRKRTEVLRKEARFARRAAKRQEIHETFQQQMQRTIDRVHKRRTERGYDAGSGPPAQEG